jgi:hypothetical protein|tara:strand:- start:1173 stop:1355 length:183 start_codon:yes stop_codon:yes gene_type:complete
MIETNKKLLKVTIWGDNSTRCNVDAHKACEIGLLPNYQALGKYNVAAETHFLEVFSRNAG